MMTAGPGTMSFTHLDNKTVKAVSSKKVEALNRDSFGPSSSGPSSILGLAGRQTPGLLAQRHRDPGCRSGGSTLMPVACCWQDTLPNLYSGKNGVMMPAGP